MQPHYEKVARLFNGPDAVHPGIILMTRVDCASKVFSLFFFLIIILHQGCILVVSKLLLFFYL